MFVAQIQVNSHQKPTYMQDAKDIYVVGKLYLLSSQVQRVCKVEDAGIANYDVDAAWTVNS